jgi:hypothetical protein
MSAEEQCIELVIEEPIPDVGKPNEHRCRKSVVEGKLYCKQHSKQHE